MAAEGKHQLGAADEGREDHRLSAAMAAKVGRGLVVSTMSVGSSAWGAVAYLEMNCHRGLEATTSDDSAMVRCTGRVGRALWHEHTPFEPVAEAAGAAADHPSSWAHHHVAFAAARLAQWLPQHSFSGQSKAVIEDPAVEGGAQPPSGARGHYRAALTIPEGVQRRELVGEEWV